MSTPTRVKYARTFHLPWSPGSTSDDKMHSEVESLFAGREIVVTEKLDGENSSIYADGFTHARSRDSKSHPSRTWIRQLACRIGAEEMPGSLRVCGENLAARHSISYRNLSSFFQVFGVYDGDQCLSWDETLEWCDLLKLTPVPVLYQGLWDENKVRACWTGRSTASPGDEQEGYVLRVVDAFKMEDFGIRVAKYVRAGHVDVSAKHWMHQAMVPNELRK